MNKNICLGFSVVVIFLFVGPLVIQPVFADTVNNTGSPVLSKNTKTWKTFFNVSNNGSITDAIYDVHFTIQGATLISVSRPKLWKSSQAGQTVAWTTDKDPIPDGFKNDGFDINTNGPNYRVSWATTNKTGSIVGSGSLTVGT